VRNKEELARSILDVGMYWEGGGRGEGKRKKEGARGIVPVEEGGRGHQGVSPPVEREEQGGACKEYLDVGMGGSREEGGGRGVREEGRRELRGVVDVFPGNDKGNKKWTMMVLNESGQQSEVPSSSLSLPLLSSPSPILPFLLSLPHAPLLLSPPPSSSLLPPPLLPPPLSPHPCSILNSPVKTRRGKDN
jgi:hypothetical protein